MIISHQSDLHGYIDFPVPNAAEIVINSGDWLPNLTRGDRQIEVPSQREFLIENAQELKSTLNDRPFFFLPGNHDFLPPEYIKPILDNAGIENYDIRHKVVKYDGLSMYGFPWVPYMAGEWNYECTASQMTREIRVLKDILQDNQIDILVCHCPPAGILDKGHGTDHMGNIQLTDLFSYNLDEKHFPKIILCGHAHDSFGFENDFMGMKVSNAATGQRLIDTETRMEKI